MIKSELSRDSEDNLEFYIFYCLVDEKCSITNMLCSKCLQHGSYELPLLWRETPVKVSCPVSHSQAQSNGPLSICCFPQGLSVNVQGGSAAELLKVNGKSDHFQQTKVTFLFESGPFSTAVRGHWTPLIELVEPCGFTLDGQDGELFIAAPFFTCGITLMVKFRGNYC